MSTPILYFNSTSPPSRAVYMLLKHLNIDFEVKTVDTMKGEQFSPDFVKLNPAAQVPTFVDGDFVLTESRAILAYIVNSRKPGSDLYPAEPKARAVVDQRLNYDHALYTKNGAIVVSIDKISRTTLGPCLWKLDFFNTASIDVHRTKTFFSAP